jgi:two-component system, OmpR family, phosphate regulon response regulator OmpR
MEVNVLVADDDAPMLGLVAQALRQFGVVTLADNGDELLQAIAETTFDLIVTDIQMPWMTGLHVACSVRAAGLNVPVIVMTALPIPAATVEVLGPGTVLLRKPFRTEELIAAASRLLNGN